MPSFGERIRLSVKDTVMVILGPADVITVGSKATEFDEPLAYPTDSRAIIIPSQGVALFDDVLYTLQFFSSHPCDVTLGGRSMHLVWLRVGDHYMASTHYQFHQVGWTDWRVLGSGMRIKILSRKMDYETDYSTMVHELENEVRGLTAKLISTVVSPMTLTEQHLDLWSYWLAVLKHVWTEMSRDVLAAWRRLPPHLKSEERLAFVERLPRPRSVDLSAYARTGSMRVVTEVRVWERMTLERQYILQLLNDMLRRLQRIFARVPLIRDSQQFADIGHDLARLLRRLLVDSGLERMTGMPKVPTSPLAQAHPALRKVVHWHRILQMGLFPDGGEYFVGPKDINLLYEYWCYLTIVRIVVGESGGTLKVPPVASVKPDDIILPSGADYATEVQLPDGGIVQILYERRFQGLPTVAQQPDHVVRVRGRNLLLVFDAKYRFELNDRLLARYGADGPIPPIDTINGMHQYHDAIVSAVGSYERIVNRAIVLFPLPNEYYDGWINHRFFQSIRTIGVGALPLLPGGSDTYVRQEIRRVLRRTEGNT